MLRLRVENLSSRVSWQDLKDVFRRGGEVTFAEAHTVITSFNYYLLETLLKYKINRR